MSQGSRPRRALQGAFARYSAQPGIIQQHRPRRPRSAMPHLRRPRPFQFTDKGYGRWFCRGCGMGGDGLRLVQVGQARRLPDSRFASRDGGRQGRRGPGAGKRTDRGKPSEPFEAVARGRALSSPIRRSTDTSASVRLHHHRDRGEIAPLRCELVSLAIKDEMAGDRRPDHPCDGRGPRLSPDICQTRRGRQSAGRSATSVFGRPEAVWRRRLVRQIRAIRARRRRGREVLLERHAPVRREAGVAALSELGIAVSSCPTRSAGCASMPTTTWPGKGLAPPARLPGAGTPRAAKSLFAVTRPRPRRE